MIGITEVYQQTQIKIVRGVKRKGGCLTKALQPKTKRILKKEESLTDFLLKKKKCSRQSQVFAPGSFFFVLVLIQVKDNKLNLMLMI